MGEIIIIGAVMLIIGLFIKIIRLGIKGIFFWMLLLFCGAVAGVGNKMGLNGEAIGLILAVILFLKLFVFKKK